MRAFTVLDGLVAPLDRANVDTDAIIPKQFLKYKNEVSIFYISGTEISLKLILKLNLMLFSVNIVF